MHCWPRTKDCLEGGDPERGQAIAFRNSTAQCMKCHAYDDYGGNAGPRLNGVGSRLSRAQILESLILPSAQLAPGYGTVILAMKDGRKISGVLQAEDEQQLTVQVGNQEPVVLPKDEIATRTQCPLQHAQHDPLPHQETNPRPGEYASNAEAGGCVRGLFLMVRYWMLAARCWILVT